MTSQDLAALRKSLDDIDAVLVSALGERARLSRQIADVKAGEDGPVRDADRETALRAGSSIGFTVRVDGAVVCSGRGRAPAAPDREAALFRIRGAERRLEVELAASPLLERVVFLRLARPDGLPLR